MEERVSDHCFVCGSNNGAGLRLSIASGAGVASAEFRPDVRWEGYPGVVHGGVVSAMLDDLMTHAASSVAEQPVVTASLEVRFRRPALINSCLYCDAQAGELRRGRLVDARAELHDQDGQLIATAKGKFMIISHAEITGLAGQSRDCSGNKHVVGAGV